MVRVTGLEPAQRKLLGPKPSASTNFATPAYTATSISYTYFRCKRKLTFWRNNFQNQNILNA